ncbi:MAG: ATP phosphoribosyltransferase regulatory subunit [Holophagaceae bacterium]|uniref:Histidine--tRNA ligase n=1 Tax=Candidatus Geothrix odensensis TaxID=2954440 RepID=A0A936F4G0_9BACT|nr:ATP phosphoribosyltransferase regulatory subunit [Candidatus Geothrix odensensis]
MAQSVKGMRDLFGAELRWFQHIEDTARRVFGRHGYGEIRTPILEELDVFKRSVGESSDIVNKEMYQFTDKGGREVVMRPENTAGVVRAAIQHKLLLNNDPVLFYYIGQQFRYERMQTGRYRQFWQIGAESFGVATPESEAESLLMLHSFLTELGLKSLVFSINSVGTPESRPAFHAAFRAFFAERADQFCDDCHRRIETNPCGCWTARTSAARPPWQATPSSPTTWTRPRRRTMLASRCCSWSWASPSSRIPGWCAAWTTTPARPSRCSAPISAPRAPCWAAAAMICW